MRTLNRCYFIFVFLISITGSCLGQNKSSFQIKKVPEKYLSVVNNKSLVLEKNSSISASFNLTKILPENYVKNGTVDYTKYIQEGINRNKILLMPDFPILINEKGIKLNDNQTLIFQKNSILVMKPNSLGTYSILELKGVNNVVIYDPVIIGDRQNHMSNEGEWGMGINIISSKNIKIFNPNISKCWGDGIYIGEIKKKDIIASKYSSYSQNVEIYHPKIDNNRRNGISIISVDGLKIVNPVISNISGTAPMSAIDIEPNSKNNTINNVAISNPITYNCRNGIVIMLTKLISPNSKEVNIKINNHIDDSSSSGLVIARFKDNYGRLAKPLNGKIEITNTQLIDNKNPFIYSKNYGFSPQILISNFKFLKSGLKGNIIDNNRMKQMKSAMQNDKKIIFN